MAGNTITVASNRRPADDRRPSARFQPAAAEPLLVLDSPPRPPSSRSNRSRGASLDASIAMPSSVSPVREGDPQSRSGEDGAPTTPEPTSLIASVRSYPRAVFFMLGNEFCERFSFYGMRAVLIMYFIYQHHFDNSTAKFLYHGFVSLAYLSPLLGSIAADNYFGPFRVILWVSLCYVMGHALLTVGAIPYLSYGFQAALDFTGLTVIALSTGGIKPCVSAFAADQFSEHQTNQRAQFFSFFYFAINGGSLLAILLTPIFRGRVSCFGSPYCFPLAFGVPGVLMFLAFIIFLCGWRFYKIKPAGRGNVVWKVIKCIGHAARGKAEAVVRRQDKATHWVDYASPAYSDSLIAGVKSLLAVSLLFVPVVFFWALFDQQGSTWVLQASQMDGRVGPFTILPDQMTTFNPLIVLIMVPIFEAFIYPAVRRCVAVTPLRKMAAGGILAALAFVIAGFLQLHINGTLEQPPQPGMVDVQVFGGPIKLNGTVFDSGKHAMPFGSVDITADGDDKVTSVTLTPEHEAYVIGGSESSVSVFPYSLKRASNGQTDLYILVSDESPLIGSDVVVLDNNQKVRVFKPVFRNQTIHIQPAIISSQDYQIRYGIGCTVRNVSACNNYLELLAETGAAHVLHLATDRDLVELRKVVQCNSVSVLWQLPQFFVITLGEVLFSVTGLEFSYSQAAPNMKSVLQAMWLLTTFFGNVIDMGISGSRLFTDAALEFFFYAFLMFIVVGVFILIAANYKYVDKEALESMSSDDDDDELDDNDNATGTGSDQKTKSEKEQHTL